MINHQVTITGWIKTSHLQHPIECWEDECFKYTLELMPENYSQLCDLEVQVYEAKKHHRELAEVAAVPSSEDYGTREDKIFNGCLLCFETLKKPVLQSYLEHKPDEDMHWCYVRVNGNIKVHKDGNDYITCHQITPF